MRVPLSWLKEYVSFDLTADELAERLALTGTEVERVSQVGLSAADGNLDRFIIGQIKNVEPHPAADKLSLCELDLGGGRTEKVVCGAKNYSPGDKAAICLPGGTLPDGRTLEAAVIRGIESRGMMCSESELGLSTESSGIMVLPAEAPVGGRLSDFIPVSEEVLELEITPNRPDCLSMYGVAREVSAILDVDLRDEPIKDIDPSGSDNIEELITIEVLDPENCPRYGARIISGVKVGPSPQWLKARIVAAGMRPVNNIVDITNYVMWTLGEPMHAFDLRKVAGGKIVVRPASDGEKITTIDGNERVLDRHMLVIADADKPSAIAGIMGSAGSEVSEDTVDILLEAANFQGSSILKTSMRLGLRSESSTRFEKGLDPDLVPKSLAMASRLMVEICGGRLVPGQYDNYSGPPAPEAVHLRRQKLEQVLGLAVSETDIAMILSRLRFKVKTEGGEMHVAVPSFRADVSREIDLIEEVARVFGLESIPSTLPSGMRVMGGLSAEQKAERDITRSLKDAGLSEVITYTFVAPDFADTLRLDPADARREVLRLANPISTEQSVMRTAMLPSLLSTVQSNLSQSNRNVNIFEQGRVYLAAGRKKLPREVRMLAGCMSGSLYPPAWTGEARRLDFFTGKGVVEAAIAAVNGRFEVRPGAEPFLHPGKSVEFLIGGEPAGYVGEVHPLVLQAYGIDQPTVAFEIDQERLISSSMGIVVFEDIITYPPSYQDIAVVVDEQVSAHEVLDVVRESAGPLLRLARVFDVYSGDQLGVGKKSIALNLEFRSPDRTLTDEDVVPLREQIVAGLAGSLGASLRA